MKKIVKSKNFFWQAKNIFNIFPKDIFLVERLISQCILSLISKKQKQNYSTLLPPKKTVLFIWCSFVITNYLVLSSFYWYIPVSTLHLSPFLNCFTFLIEIYRIYCSWRVNYYVHWIGKWKYFYVMLFMLARKFDILETQAKSFFNRFQVFSALSQFHVNCIFGSWVETSFVWKC